MAAHPGDLQARHRVPRLGQIGDSYIHPFGTFGSGKGDDRFPPLLDCGSRAFRRDVRRSANIRWRCTMAYMNRFARPDPDPQKIESTFNYAYQFDATLFAPYLRRIAENLGAQRTEGRIVDVALRR